MAFPKPVLPEKACTVCGVVKLLEDFVVQKSKSDGRSAQCKACTTLRKKQRRAELRAREAIPIPDAKLCSGCNTVKLAREFRKCKTDPTGLSIHCRDCSGRKVRDWRKKNPEKVRASHRRTYEPERQRRAVQRELLPDRFTPDGQLCSRCRIRLPLTEFHKSAQDPSGYVSICKQCSVEKTRQWLADNPERARKSRSAAHRKRKYGISAEAYEILLSSQGGKCAICHAPVTDEYEASVDHNHETGAIRGILCKKCNTGLGMFNDNPRKLQLAIEYLAARGEV